MTELPHEERQPQNPEVFPSPRPDTPIRIGEAGVKAVSFDTELTVTPGASELPSADEIPSLLPLLHSSETAHKHTVDESITVYAKMREAKNTDPSERTAEQVQLIEDVATLKRFAPYASAYEDIYTPEELHGLVEKLELLGQKNRPDFDDIEGKILDVVLSTYAEGEISVNLRGIAKRAAEDDTKRRGMQWTTLTKLAGAATAVLHDTMLKSPDRQGYIIGIDDPEPQRGPDLTPVYQFAASSYAYDVVATRSRAVQGQRRDAYVANCDIINQWYEATASAIARLPINFTVDDRIPAGWQVNNLIETMNTRLVSADRSGRDKGYKVDPHGAIKLQRRIGHLVEEIKQKLDTFSQPDETEITPLT